MRIECPKCQSLFDAKGASVEKGELHIACSKCKETLSLAILPSAKAKKPAPAKAALSDGHACPKCSALVAKEAEACSGCGLASEHFSEFEAEVDEENHSLEEVWQRVCEDWDDEEGHEAFMRHVAQFSDYLAAAARYRESMAVPARGERSEQMLARIQSMATAALLATRPKGVQKKETFRPVLMLLIVIVLIAGMAGMYFIFFKAKPSQSGKEGRVRQPWSIDSKKKPPATEPSISPAHIEAREK